MLSKSLREKYGTDSQLTQQPKAEKKQEISEWAKRHLERVGSSIDVRVPHFERVNAKFMEIHLNEIRKNGIEPVVDTRTAFIIKNLCKYLVNDETSSYNQNKSIMLFGSVGTGKTLIMKSLQKTAGFFNLHKKFSMSSVPRIFQKLQVDKDAEVSEYFDNHRCFDDVGFSEPTLITYGQKSRPMDLIMSVRYEKFVNEGLLTHMTTNLSLDTLDTYFDARIVDRLKEMCNFISFQGESFRGR